MAQVMRKTTGIAQDVNQEAAGQGAAQAGVGIIFTFAGVVAAWSVACMIGGIANAGGIGQLAKAWMTAVTGM